MCLLKSWIAMGTRRWKVKNILHLQLAPTIHVLMKVATRSLFMIRTEMDYVVAMVMEAIPLK